MIGCRVVALFISARSSGCEPLGQMPRPMIKEGRYELETTATRSYPVASYPVATARWRRDACRPRAMPMGRD